MGKKRKRSGEGKESSASEGEEPAPKARPSSPKRFKPAVEAASQSKEDSEVVEEKDRLELLISAFSNSQQDQYEIFRRSTFPKSTIRKLMQGICGGTVPQNAVIAMAGIAKVFVGEIVEEACQAKDKDGSEGPLQPKHIREAVRKLKNNNKMTNAKYKRVFPSR